MSQPLATVGKATQDALEAPNITCGEPRFLTVDVVADDGVALCVFVDEPVVVELGHHLTGFAIDGLDPVVDPEDLSLDSIHLFLRL